MELELIDDAIEKDLPIFAICRGLQILNVYHGGTLIQHLSSAERHDGSAGILRSQYMRSRLSQAVCSRTLRARVAGK